MTLESLLEEIKQRSDIVGIINRYVPLKRRGSSWVGLCPFHQEKTPSFSVNPQKGLFKCFGCGRGGDVFRFFMELEGLGFIESVRKVAELEGIPFPNSGKGVSNEEKKKREIEKSKLEKILEINYYTMQFWKKQLFEKEGEKAIEYLRKREISNSTVETFQIGYAPRNWQSLLQFLKAEGFEESLIRESGIFAATENDEIYGRFRNRIIFPIFDEVGKVVAFGGRTLGDGEPKYLNSPETLAYVKSKHLYGLFHTKEEIKRRGIAIVVEGYLDLISLYQAGIKPVVASLGTAFSTEQARLISKFARKIIINYDGDDAGVRAIERALESILTIKGVEVKILILPDGLDPDAFVRQKGSEVYREYLKQAAFFDEFLVKRVVCKPNLADALESSLRITRSIPDRLKKRKIFDEIMLALKITDIEHQRELWNQVKADTSSNIQRAVNQYLKSGITTAEKRLLEILYHSEKAREFILPKIEKEDYNNLLTASLFEAFYRLYHERKGNFPSDEIAYFVDKDDESLELLYQSISSANFSAEESDEELIEEAIRCLIKLRVMVIENKILENSRSIMLAEESGDYEKLKELVQEQIKLNRLILQIEKELKN